MRIAVVCSYYPWPPSVGGAETIVRNVSTELARRGHEVHVITTPFDVTTMKQVSDYGMEERNGVIMHKLRPVKMRVGHGRFLKGLKGTIKSIRPEIVHSHHLHPHTLQLANWKDKFNYGLIAELHHPVVALDTLSAKIAFPIVFYFLKKKAENIDALIAHTDLERKWLEGRGIPSEKIHIVRFPAVPSELLSYHLYSKCLDENYILFLGRLTWIKGVHILIRAFKHIKDVKPDLRLKLAGPSDQQYEKYLRDLSKKLHLKSSIDFLGPIYDNEKNHIIECSKILVLPSLKEYTPNVLLEAQALGVPVIATRVGAVPEMMIDGETGILVEPGDELELARAVKILIENNDLRERFSLNAREFVKNFTLEATVDKLEALYHALL